MGADQSQNAMTEIALALAMAFFAIMVLAMISMGAGMADPDVSVTEDDAVSIQSAQLQEQEPSPATQGGTTIGVKDLIVVHWEGAFWDADLQPLQPNQITDHAGRVVLALAPGLALTEALEVRSQLQHDQLIVSTLDDAWVQRLRRIKP